MEHEKVKNIPKTFMLKDDTDRYGFVEVSGGVVKSWNVAHNNPHGALTAVHETGHLVDEIFLTSSQRKRILDIVKSSEEYQAMISDKTLLSAKKKLSKIEKRKLATLEEATTDRELIARAYVQRTVKNTEGELLEQFKKDGILYHCDKYFSTVSTEIEDAFAEILPGVGL